MYLFLQNLRATLIPTIAVPVVLLGTFAVLSLAGYSINVLTMFAMVLAIGLLVDDAIVVIENVERVMAEEGLSPRDATRKSMDQITGALVGIALVLAAVFLPMAFFTGSTGVIYRQFSITIVSAMILSVLIALIFTPGALRDDPRAGRKGAYGKEARLLRSLQPHLQPRQPRLRERREACRAPQPGSISLIYVVVVAAHGVPLPARAHRRSCPMRTRAFMFVQVNTPVGATVGPHRRRCSTRSASISRRRKRTRSTASSPSPASASAAAARVPASPSSISRTVVAAARRAEPRPGHRRPRHGLFLHDQGRDGLRLRAARRARAGQRHRLRLRAARSRQPGPRAADGRAQPAPRHGGEGSDARARCAPTASTTSRNTGSTSTAKRRAPSA